MHEVFISYSTKDRKVADEICCFLEEREIRCWYAPRDVKSGEEWAGAIVQAIKKASFFVLIYSENSNSSEHVLREVAQGASCGCTIIPFRIDRTQMCDGMSYYLNTVHWLDAVSAPAQKNLQKLYELICSIDKKEPVVKELASGTGKKRELFRRIRGFFSKHQFLQAVAWCLVIGLVICGYLSIEELFDPDMIKFSNISEYTEYSYPFYSLEGFSVDRKLQVLKNKETGKLRLTKASTGDFLSAEIDYECEDMSNVYVHTKENSNTIYFINTLKNSVRVYDRGKDLWVTDEIVLPLKETEDYQGGAYYDSGFSVGENNPDDFYMLTADFADESEEGYYSRIFHLKPDGSYVEHDISKYKIHILLAGIKKDDRMQFLAYNSKKNFVVLDVEQGVVPDLTYNEIKESYLPYVVQNANDRVSDDNRYVVWVTDNLNETRVSITDFQTDKTESEAFRPEAKINYAFTSDNRLLVFNRQESTLYSYNPEGDDKTPAMSEKILLSREDFEKNKDFVGLPICFWYCEKLDLCFFATLYTDDSGKGISRIIATDENGVVKGSSQAINLDSLNLIFGFHFSDNGQVLFELTYFTDEDVFSNTQVYRAQYSVDEKGKLVWD